MHYRDVFLCINSKGDRDLRVTDKRHRSGSSYNPDAVAEQLKPGTIYMDFAYFEGPGGLRGQREDSVGNGTTACGDCS